MPGRPLEHPLLRHLASHARWTGSSLTPRGQMLLLGCPEWLLDLSGREVVEVQVTVPMVTLTKNHCNRGVGDGLGPGTMTLRQAGRSSWGRGSAAKTEPRPSRALRIHVQPARRRRGGPRPTAAGRSQRATVQGPAQDAGCLFPKLGSVQEGPCGHGRAGGTGIPSPPRVPALPGLRFAAAKVCRFKGRSLISVTMGSELRSSSQPLPAAGRQLCACSWSSWHSWKAPCPPRSPAPAARTPAAPSSSRPGRC